MLPAICLYGIDYLYIYNLSCLICDVVHCLYPSHHIGCFELFGDTLLLFELRNKTVIHLCCSDINIVQIAVKFAIHKQRCVEHFVVLFDITKVLLSPHTNLIIRFGGDEVREINLSNQRVIKSVILI